VANVFVSYARGDRERIQPLVAALEAEGLSVWWDPALVPGRRFREMIAHELATADSVVVVWTRQALESDWVQDEAEEARQRGVLIPVMLEPVKPPAGFRQVQAANLSQWTGSREHPEFRALALAAKGLVTLSAEGGAQPTPEPDDPDTPDPAPPSPPKTDFDPAATVIMPPPAPKPAFGAPSPTPPPYKPPPPLGPLDRAMALAFNAKLTFALMGVLLVALMVLARRGVDNMGPFMFVLTPLVSFMVGQGFDRLKPPDPFKIAALAGVGAGLFGLLVLLVNEPPRKADEWLVAVPAAGIIFVVIGFSVFGAASLGVYLITRRPG
jgi:hypothetical protein